VFLRRDARAEAVALIALLGCALASVVVFFPAEGHVLVPLHGMTDFLLGSAAFVLPLSLALAAGLGFVRRSRPEAALPRRKLAGLALITIGLFPADSLLGQSTGVVGGWFTGTLVSVLGGPLTVVITMAMLAMGCALTFELWRGRIAAR
jgi:hypothetical protein